MREMKDSGIPWLGTIPRDWNVLKVKNLVRRKSDKNMPDEQVLSLYRELGIVIKADRDDNHNVTSENTDNYKFVEANDLVVNKMKAWQGSIAVSAYQGIVSPAYYVYRFTSPKCYPWYVHYILRCAAYLPEYRRLSGGIRLGQWDLSDDNFKNIPLPIPEDFEEQKRIVDYLDSKCSKIDEIIAKQEQIIGKLKEYKLSVITEVVTKGLKPNMEMKDSEVEWAGKIPQSWRVTKISHICRTSSGSTPDRGKYDEYYEGGSINWIKTLDLNDWFVSESSEKITETALANSSCSILPAGTVCVAMYGGAGTIGKCGLLKMKSATNQAVCAMVPNNELLPVFLLFQLLTLKKDWMRYAVGTRKDPNISQDTVGRMRIIIPNLAEQEEIISYLCNLCEAIDTTIEKKEKIIEKLVDYKKSVVYEVVTGKKEV